MIPPLVTTPCVISDGVLNTAFMVPLFFIFKNAVICSVKSLLVCSTRRCRFLERSVVGFSLNALSATRTSLSSTRKDAATVTDAATDGDSVLVNMRFKFSLYVPTRASYMGFIVWR